MVGRNAGFVDVLQKMMMVAHTKTTVLVLGETGTGKELVAKAVHDRSERASRAFVAINCGALPEHLVENELFGHTKGAYTDASKAASGLVASAEGGTLFLDEVDSLSVGTQGKLLRFLQDRSYRPVGYDKTLHADVRVIAATNANLGQKIVERSFREDLYYRISVAVLQLPALRERLDDILPLAQHFLNVHALALGKAVPTLSAKAVTALMQYSWPGNVRELETAVHRAVLFTNRTKLEPGDFGITNPIFHMDKHIEKPTFSEAKARVVTEFERQYLTNVLRENGGNVTKAAHQAGKERRCFQRLLAKYGLAGQGG